MAWNEYRKQDSQWQLFTHLVSIQWHENPQNILKSLNSPPYTPKWCISEQVWPKLATLKCHTWIYNRKFKHNLHGFHHWPQEIKSVLQLCFQGDENWNSVILEVCHFKPLIIFQTVKGSAGLGTHITQIHFKMPFLLTIRVTLYCHHGFLQALGSLFSSMLNYM